MTRTLLVEGKKTFRITIPDDCKITFGPWSPGEKNNYEGAKTGTLRVYESKNANANILGVWSGVSGFREDNAISYEEQIAREEGAIIWKSSKDGYKREENVKRETEWLNPAKELTEGEKETDEV